MQLFRIIHGMQKWICITSPGANGKYIGPTQLNFGGCKPSSNHGASGYFSITGVQMLNLWARAVKSNQNQIVFDYQINIFSSDQIKSYADRIEWILRFSIRLYLIWMPIWIRKGEKKNVTEKVKNSKKALTYNFVSYFWHRGGPPLESGQFHNGHYCWQAFLSNWIVFWIESILNGIKLKGFCTSCIKDQIKTDSIWQPCFEPRCLSFELLRQEQLHYVVCTLYSWHQIQVDWHTQHRMLVGGIIKGCYVLAAHRQLALCKSP
jgi:hypothetical protein